MILRQVSGRDEEDDTGVEEESEIHQVQDTLRHRPLSFRHCRGILELGA